MSQTPQVNLFDPAFKQIPTPPTLSCAPPSLYIALRCRMGGACGWSLVMMTSLPG